MTNLLICSCIHLLNLIAFFKKAHKHAYPANGHLYISYCWTHSYTIRGKKYIYISYALICYLLFR